jgi:hypothetical protein
VVPSFPLDPIFTRSNPVEDAGFFKGDKNPEYDFLRRGSKAIICKILRYVKESHEYERDASWAEFTGHFLAKFLVLRYFISLLVTARELWWTNQEWMITQMGTHNRSEMVVVQGLPCDPTPQG